MQDCSHLTPKNKIVFTQQLNEMKRIIYSKQRIRNCTTHLLLVPLHRNVYVKKIFIVTIFCPNYGQTLLNSTPVNNKYFTMYKQYNSTKRIPQNGTVSSAVPRLKFTHSSVLAARALGDGTPDTNTYYI